MTGRRIGDLMAAGARRDTLEDITERMRRAALLAQVQREREARYPIINPQNVDEVLAWQDARIRDLMAGAA